MRMSPLAMLLAIVAVVFVTPAHATWLLTSISPSRLNVVQDGTSNTILLGEGSRGALCFDDVAIPGGIHDGTSNTILFGENAGLHVTPGFVSSRLPIAQIADGTSNTIVFGETPPTSACLGNVQFGDVITPPIPDGTSNTIVFGEDTHFDACFNDVRLGTIADGSSNTLLFGENESGLCYHGVGLANDFRATVPEPGTLFLLGGGLAAGGFMRRRRKSGVQALRP